MTPTLEARLTSRISIDQVSGCWVITGKTTTKGYVQIWVQNEPGFSQQMIHAHRLMYIITRGSVDPGLVVDHLCCNIRCVNPYHLEAVTSGENTRRGKATKTHCPQGHPYTGENVRLKMYQGRPHRYCRKCGSIHSKSQKLKRMPGEVR